MSDGQSNGNSSNYADDQTLAESIYTWDETNIRHIARHNIEPYEAEEALEDPNRASEQAYGKSGEKRRAFVGETLDKRILFVVYTLRQKKYRVITARKATQDEKRNYYKRQT